MLIGSARPPGVVDPDDIDLVMVEALFIAGVSCINYAMQDASYIWKYPGGACACEHSFALSRMDGRIQALVCGKNRDC